MRWSYLFSRLTVLALVWAAFFFGTDPLLKWALGKAGAAAAGAKVDISKVKTKFFPPSMTVTGVAVGDKEEPFKNVVEFQRLAMSFEGRPLLEKKFIVREAGLYGLRFGTARKTSAALPAPPKTSESAMAKKAKAMLQSGQEFSLDRYSDMKSSAVGDAKAVYSSLETPRLAEELKAKFADDAVKWKTRVDSANFQARLDNIKAKAAALEKNSDPLKKAAAATELIKEANSLKTEIETLKKDSAFTFSMASGAAARLDEARKKDMAAVMSAMKLPSIDAKSVAYYLLGPAIGVKLEKYLGWYAAARKYIPESDKARDKAENKERLRKGMVIEFPKEQSWPSFAIRKMAIDGELGQDKTPLVFSGEAGGISNQPKIYGQPAYAKLSGGSGTRRFNLGLTADRTRDPGRDAADLEVSGFPVQSFKAGSPSSIEINVDGGSGAVNGQAEISSGAINAEIVFRAQGVKVGAAAQSGGAVLDLARKAITSSLEKLTLLEVKLKLSGQWDCPEVAIESNIASEVSKGLGEFVGREVENYKKQAAAAVEKYQQQARGELEKQVSGLKTQADGQLDGMRKNIDSLTAGLQKTVQEKAKGLLPPGTNIPEVKIPSVKIPKLSF